MSRHQSRPMRSRSASLLGILAALLAAGAADAQSGAPRQVTGTIVSVADKKLTLTLSDKTTESWPIADSARIVFVRRMQTLADIAPGDRAHVFVGKDGAINMIQLLAMKKPRAPDPTPVRPRTPAQVPLAPAQ